MADYIFKMKQKKCSTLKTRATNIKEAKDKITKRMFKSFNGLCEDDFILELDRVDFKSNKR